MTNPNHRPKVLPDGVRVETSVPIATGEAIDLLAKISGTNKRTVLRGLIHAGLERTGSSPRRSPPHCPRPLTQQEGELTCPSSEP